MLILGTPYPNDHSFHRAIATEIEDGFKVASDWGRGEFDSNTIRIEFSIDHDIKVGHEVPMSTAILVIHVPVTLMIIPSR